MERLDAGEHLLAPRVLRAPPPAGALRGRDGPPTFSVIIAAYEAASFVGEAIESALAQTMRPHEVIVCDDGSTDDIDAALAPYRPEIVFIRKAHGGAASAKNAAVGAATGEFVVQLDADDAYLPERLGALAELAVQRPDLDILATDAWLEVDGRRVARFNRETEFALGDQKSAILSRCFCAWPAVRRTRMLEVGGFDESVATADDWGCLIRLILSGSSAGLVDEPLYLYRLRPESLTAARTRTLRDRVSLLERAAQHPRLTRDQRRSAERSVAAQRNALLLAEAEAALRGRHPDARRRSLAVAMARQTRLMTRLAGLAAAIAPGAAGRLLHVRARRPGGSRLARSRWHGAQAHDLSDDADLRSSSLPSVSAVGRLYARLSRRAVSEWLNARRSLSLVGWQRKVGPPADTGATVRPSNAAHEFSADEHG